MRNAIIKAAIRVSVAAVLLTSPKASFALMEIAEVSTERAIELGMEVHSNAAGPDAVRVELEFNTVGELESYLRVDLLIHEDGKLLIHSTLREQQASDERIVVGFAANRARLDTMTLRVVTGAPRNLVGYDLQVDDFVDLEKLR